MFKTHLSRSSMQARQQHITSSNTCANIQLTLAHSKRVTNYGDDRDVHVGGQARLDSPRLSFNAQATLGLSAIPCRTGSEISTTSPKLQTTAKQHPAGNASVLDTMTEGGEERNE